MESKNASVIFIGDPHFQVSNIVEVDMFIEKITNLAKEKKPDIIIIGGDLLHTHERLHTIALNKAYELVEKMKNITKTYVLVGNHDYIQNQQFLTENHWMNGMKKWDNTVIVDKVISENINDNFFIFSPYVPPGRFVEALNTLNNDEWKKANCIFAHQEFFGCKMGAIISVDGDKWPLDYPHIISGHIHSRQIPQKNIYYTGSAMQHAFGESEKNIIAYLTFTKGEKNYIKEEIDLNLPRKKIIYMDVEDVENYKVVETKDKIKVSVSGVYEQFKAFKKTKKYKNLVEKGVKVTFKPKKIEEKISKEKQEEVINNGSSDFVNILNNLVENDKNVFLTEIFELVVNNKEINSSDIMFLE